MSSNKVCPSNVVQQHAQKAEQSTPSPIERALMKDLLIDLDSRDGSCDGTIDPLNGENRAYATSFITALKLPAFDESRLLGTVWSLYDSSFIKPLPKLPYKEMLKRASQFMSWVDTMFPGSEPSLEIEGPLKEKLDLLNSTSPEKEAFYTTYAGFVDELYEESGLPLLNKMIDDAEFRSKNRVSEKFDPDDVLGDAMQTPQWNGSTDELFQQLKAKDFLEDIHEVSPEGLKALYEHKKKAEELFVSTLMKEVDVLKEDFLKDPSLYWIPLVAVLSSESFNNIERTGAHVSLLLDLYNKVSGYTTDEADKIFFEIEYRDKTRLPLERKELQAYYDKILGMIDSLNKDDPDHDAKLSKYYSTLGRVWYHKYLGAAEAFDVNVVTLISLEEELREVMNKRRDHASENEVGIYLDNVNTIASVWTDKGGLVSHKLWSEGLPAVRTDLMRLATVAKEAESLASGCMLSSGGSAIKEALADIRWKVNGEAYIRAGLSRTGLRNIDSEQPSFRLTNSYKEHLNELFEKYPWLMSNGRITLSAVGSNGKEARDISEAAFLQSSSMVREASLPMILGVVGSGFGLPGTVAGGFLGKGVNEVINLNDPDVKEILSNAEQTGIPIISKDLARQFRSENATDWAFNAFSSLLMCRFSRSLLSIGRGSVQASFKYISTGAFTRTIQHGAVAAVKSVPKLPSMAKTAVVNGSVKTATGVYDTFRFSVPNFFTKSVPGAFSKAGVLGKYGSVTGWTRTKFLFRTSYDGWLGFWNKWGVPIQWTSGIGGMAYDYLPDGKFNGWSGPLGASLLINVTYGPKVWGWNPNGGMAGFAWRYGFELTAQWLQGQDIKTPDMAYTTFGMFTSYTIRGVNKLGSIGRPIVNESPVLKRITRFVERNDVSVPQSVVGRSRIPGRLGMVRGDVLRLGKPPKMNPSYLKSVQDGHVLSVEMLQNTGGRMGKLRILKKWTGKSGKPVIAEEIRNVPLAGRLGRWFSQTTYPTLGDATIYRLPNKIIEPVTRALAAKSPKLAKLNQWWVKLGKKASDAKHPIFNFRGSVANSELLPLIGITGALGGLLQGSDPKQTGALRMGDYGGAYFFQHKVQHLLRIDSFWGNMIGYAMGIPAQMFVLPFLFPSMINKAPGLKKSDVGYFPSLEKGDLDQANESIRTSITSYSFFHNVPLLGDLWNEFGPFGKVEDSNRRIEEPGAVAFWKQMYDKLDLAEMEIGEELTRGSEVQSSAELVNGPSPNMDIVTNFIKKVLRDHEEYVLKGNIPEDPVMLRLHILEMAFLKVMIKDGTHPFISEYAAKAANGIMPMLENVPELHDYEDVSKFATGLNENVLVDMD